MSMRTKLQQLEERQFELVRDNFELKQLCLILDAERDSELEFSQFTPVNGPPTANQLFNQQVLSYMRGLYLYL